MLKNANLLAKIAADTAENEQDVAEVWTICPGRELPRGPELADGGEAGRRPARLEAAAARTSPSSGCLGGTGWGPVVVVAETKKLLCEEDG